MTTTPEEVAPHMGRFLDMLAAAFRRWGVPDGLPERFRDAVAATPGTGSSTASACGAGHYAAASTKEISPELAASTLSASNDARTGILSVWPMSLDQPQGPASRMKPSAFQSSVPTPWCTKKRP
jgi:hypothetical protein